MAKKKIITKKSEAFLEKYLNNPSPTGFESGGQKMWLNYIKPYIDTHFVDTYGTVVGVINPKAKYKVVIEAHADEISWFVHYITKKGFIYLRRNGGSDHQIAPSKRVNIYTKKGIVKAELDIRDNLWFFDCHFQGDPVMPGCLGLDAMWQLVGFFLGWSGEPGKGRALGVNTVKFTGEVLKKVKMATYEINIKRILKKEGTAVGLANGILSADGKIIYTAENLKVGLFKS